VTQHRVQGTGHRGEDDAGIASLLGLVVQGVYAGPASVAEMLRGYDLVTFLVAVPVMVLAQRRAWRGSDRAWLVWAGMLAYLAYTYAYHLFGTSFNDLFLLQATVFGASVIALVLTLMALDVPAVGAGFTSGTPRRLVAVVLGLHSEASAAARLSAHPTFGLCCIWRIGAGRSGSSKAVASLVPMVWMLEDVAGLVGDVADVDVGVDVGV
jgi:hypothetical protein